MTKGNEKYILIAIAVIVVIIIVAMFIVGASTLHSVPITITNNQDAQINPGFQQMIVINPSQYASSVNGNLGNIRFYQGNTRLFSWCESGCANSSIHSVFWVKLSNAINSSSITSITMKFAPQGTNYDGYYAGEAPQLSPSYAQYDNGMNVFNFYDNFNGTKLSSSWVSWQGTSTPTVRNGITINPNSGQNGGFSTSSTFNTSNSTLDILGSISVPYSTAAIGFGISGLSYDFFNIGSLSTPVGSMYTFSSWNEELRNSTYQNFTAQYNINQVFSMWGMSSYSAITVNYKNQVNLNKTYGTVADPIAWNDYSTGTLFMQWIRIRTTPPNGVMPSVTFGQAS